MSLVSLFITFFCLSKHTKACEAKSFSIYFLQLNRNLIKVMCSTYVSDMLKYPRWLCWLYFSQLQFNVIFVGATQQVKRPRQANTLTELVKPQRQYRECVLTHALQWVVTLVWLSWFRLRALFWHAYFYSCKDIPYISKDCTTTVVMMASSQNS